MATANGKVFHQTVSFEKKLIDHQTYNSPWSHDLRESSISRQSKRTKCLCFALCLSILSTLAATGTFLYVAWCHMKHAQHPVSSDNNLCVPCSMINTDKELNKYSVDGHPICCFDSRHSDVEVAQALQLVRLEDKKGIRDNSFHVYYTEPNTRNGLSTGVSVAPHTLTSWATSGSRIHVGAGIQYDVKSGRFTVRTPGNYMIYSHMAFQPPPHVLAKYITNGRNLTFLFTHDVHVHNDRSSDDDVIAMEDSSEVTCLIRKKYGGQLYPCHVSNLVGMMPLVVGDMLSVEITPREFLLGELKSTYFGLFLMG